MSIYAFGPVLIGLAKTIEAMHQKQYADRESGLILTGAIPESQALTVLLNTYGTFGKAIEGAKKVYYYDEDTKIYIGNVNEVKLAMKNDVKSFEKLKKNETEFAVGIRSYIKWEWDKKRFSTTEFGSCFSIQHLQNEIVWNIMSNSSCIAARIPIKYRQADANILFWKRKDDSAFLPKIPTDWMIMEEYRNLSKSLTGAEKLEYDEILLPTIPLGSFERPDVSNQSSHLLQRTFGRTNYTISNFSQMASFSLDKDGGVAESRTLIIIKDATAISKPVRTLNFFNVCFGFAIEMIGAKGELHAVYLGYFTPQ